MSTFRLIPLFAALLAAPGAFAAETPIDSIIAIVDEGIVTERQLDNYIALVKRDLSSSDQRLPTEDVLRRQALDQLINRALLLQEARRRGIQISDSQLNQIMQRRARDNNMSLSEFRNTLIAQGYDYDEFRETLRTREIISTLASQYGQRYATVSEAEVDEFIELSAATDTDYEYRLSHILIALLSYGALTFGPIVALFALAQERRLRAAKLSPGNQLFAPLSPLLLWPT